MALPIITARTDIPAAVNRGWHDMTTLSAREGCTVCATQDTDELCGCHGRRCLDHPAHEDEAEEASCHS